LNNTFITYQEEECRKNTLNSLFNWLKELNTREELEKISSDIPMLPH